MKIALIQIDPIVGDFDGNVEKIIKLADGAKKAGCGMAIFPEMALCGYPPMDLLERNSFVEDHDLALAKLVGQVKGIGVICGVISRHTGQSGKPLHNSAALIDDGKCQLLHKRLLPTYDVFDESRYFEPGGESLAINFKGLVLGVTICEDIFNEPELIDRTDALGDGRRSSPPKPYQAAPVADLLSSTLNPPDLIVNIAASPFSVGKPAAKLAFFGRFCRKYQLPLLYVNQVGGQDSLVFDGQSLALNRQGDLVAKGAAFGEDMLIVDVDNWQQVKVTNPLPDQMNIAELPESGDLAAAEVFGALVAGTRAYVRKCGFKQVLLGLSGGIDSALTAAVAVYALGAENVRGVALPSPYSSKGSVDDARQLAENLQIDFQIVPISDIFQAHLKTLQPFFADLPVDVTEQNIQARIRGNLLMALANKFGGLLLSTGNKSEMAVGYCTLYGDMSGGLAVISDVPKMMVYRICHYLNSDREIIPSATIEKPPSAELAPNQEDQDDLPPYELLDDILELHLEEGLGVKEIVAKGFPGDIVTDILKRVRLNEHKRKQAPLGLKVTSKAFGYGRRYPITQRYVESG